MIALNEEPPGTAFTGWSSRNIISSTVSPTPIIRLILCVVVVVAVVVSFYFCCWYMI